MRRNADGLAGAGLESRSTFGLPWHVMQVVSKMRCGVRGGACSAGAGWPANGSKHRAAAMTPRNRDLMVTNYTEGSYSLTDSVTDRDSRHKGLGECEDPLMLPCGMTELLIQHRIILLSAALPLALAISAC